MKRLYKILLVFSILNIVDYLTTLVSLKLGAREANLIACYFIGHDAFIYFKLVGVGLLCIYLIHAAKRNSKSQARVTKLMWWANVAYSIIAVSNAVVLYIQWHYSKL